MLKKQQGSSYGCIVDIQKDKSRNFPVLFVFSCLSVMDRKQTLVFICLNNWLLCLHIVLDRLPPPGTKPFCPCFQDVTLKKKKLQDCGRLTVIQINPSEIWHTGLNQAMQ